MSKYNISFCNCGRIHIHPDENWDWMSEDYKHHKVIHVCKNCGTTHIEYLTEGGYDTDKSSFNINSYDIEPGKDLNINPDSEIKYRVQISEGIRVPMIDGNTANYTNHAGKLYYIDPEAPFARVESQLVDIPKLIAVVHEKYDEELGIENAINILKSIKSKMNNFNGYWSNIPLTIK